MKRTTIIAVLTATAWIFNSIAAEEQGLQGPSNVHRLGNDQGGRHGNQQGGPGREGAQRPKPPFISAIDVNGDRVIDADEIAGASAALKTLDKNGDGKLTPDEIMPPRQQRPEGEQGHSNREGRGNKRGGPDGEMGRGPEQGGCENCGKGQGDRKRMGNREGQGGSEGMENRQGRGGEGMGPQQGGPGREGGMRPPVPPFITVLDANGDRVIDEEEIANIHQAIKKLDKNGDGKLTINELLPRPPRMDGEQGQGNREGLGNRDSQERGRGGDRRGPPPEGQE